MANAIYRTLFLGAAGVLLGQERAPEKGAIQGTISGTVTDSLTGAPLGKAEIRTEGPAYLVLLALTHGGLLATMDEGLAATHKAAVLVSQD